ncbi:MAG: hypothetical protein GY869_01555, partial [Planctomycetes bacterium]|nr:hypothetical protein [Planctomycetota bacterium]
DNYSGDLTGGAEPQTILMDSSKSVTAHFSYIGDVIYVDSDANGLNNGGTWDNAFTDLQDGLDLATTGKEIWVAAGTYKPTKEVEDTGDRYKTFQMKNGVAIYGGFSGDEVYGSFDLVNRDPNLYPASLSGDLNGDDIPGDFSTNRDDNCYRVFYHPDGTDLDETAILDGFTISGGDGAYSMYGGGMYNNNSSPTVKDCTFSDNYAGNGGGMYNDYSSPIVTGCTFSGNSADDDGGGLVNNYSNPIVTDCTFSGNMANDDNAIYGKGGGMFNYNSSPIVTDCTFSGNIRSGHGDGG